MKEKLISEIQSYNPFNEQETADKNLILRLLGSGEDLSVRSARTGNRC